MNNDNDLNLHLHDQMLRWLRYWLVSLADIARVTPEHIILWTTPLLSILSTVMTNDFRSYEHNLNDIVRTKIVGHYLLLVIHYSEYKHPTFVVLL